MKCRGQKEAVIQVHNRGNHGGNQFMFKKKMLMATLIVAAFVSGMVRPSVAQTDAAKSPEAEKNPSAYRLDYTLSELDDGKKINTRQYSMNTRPSDWSQMKIGTRVPVEAKPGEFQYLDVGMSIRCRLDDQSNVAFLGNNVSLSVQADLSNFAIPEQNQSMRPAIRQMRIEASTVSALNKPTVVGVVDDPNSKHQFQLEVTVTKLR